MGFRSMITWQIYIRNERIANNLKHEQETTKKKIDSFLDAASTGKLWENEEQVPKQTPTSTASGSTRQPTHQIKARKTPITTRRPSLTTRSRSAVTFTERPSFTTRTQSDLKVDDFFQNSSSGHEQEENEEEQQRQPERA